VYDRWEIKNYKYILSCIDIHSRYAEGVALTRKTGAAVTQAMLKIFKKMGRVPHTLQMDNGGEFTGKAFKTAMKNAGVKVLFYSDVSDLRKQSVIERHNRTLAGLLRKWRENSGKKDWHNQLDRMYTIYNSNLHRTIKATPKDVWGLKDANKQDITKVSTNLEVGMTVRMQIKPDAFKKGDTKQYSDEILTVTAKDGKKWVLSNGERVSDTQVIEASGVPDSPRKTREATTQQADHQQTQMNRKVARKATNALKNVGAKSKFDKGVKALPAKRKRAPPKPPAPKRTPKAVTFTMDHFVHEFKHDILVTWVGYPLKEATREPKSKLRADLGVVQHAKGEADLKQNKVARKAQYMQWKALQKK
jgi:hypothetical protein